MKGRKLSNIEKKIYIRKKILNLLLSWFSPTNKLMVILSCNLDKHIAIYQKNLSLKHKHNKLVVTIFKYSVA
ncbi:hypothetical protein SAMN05421842_13818 [Clostridium uliginosum]|uniref:Uncharacterized protein n=1 Tax=Clostridium uliginosum TaxID=119641 RepID=A0A1I1RYY5_9CLOT|nr:hypothetical protein SAMN05421842_13818 [Clostridium uliginosum]